jgi:hypothetical protein
VQQRLVKTGGRLVKHARYYLNRRRFGARPEYAKRLSGFCRLKELLGQIPDEPAASAQEPFWGQEWFTTLDAVALYGMLVEFRPKRFMEIGSG